MQSFDYFTASFGGALPADSHPLLANYSVTVMNPEMSPILTFKVHCHTFLIIKTSQMC